MLVVPEISSANAIIVPQSLRLQVMRHMLLHRAERFPGIGPEHLHVVQRISISGGTLTLEVPTLPLRGVNLLGGTEIRITEGEVVSSRRMVVCAFDFASARMLPWGHRLTDEAGMVQSDSDAVQLYVRFGVGRG